MGKGLRKATRIITITKPGCPMAIPESFDANKILSSVTKRADAKLNLKDSMHFILNALNSVEIQEKYRKRAEETGFYPLHSDILSKICGVRYKVALKLLKQHGVIEIDDSFQIGEYSKGFRLTNKYLTDPLKYTELIGEDFRERYLKERKERDERNTIELSKVPFITKWFNGLIEVDVETAHKFIEFYRKEMSNILVSSAKLYTTGEYTVIENRINQKANSMLASVTRLKDGKHNLSKSGKDNRLHSTFSSVKKELRPLITYGSKKLVGIDVISSQPYFFSQLLKPEFYKEEKRKNLLEQVYPKLYSILNSTSINTKSTIIKSLTYNISTDNELLTNNFINIKWDEDFYNILIDKEKGIVSKKHLFKDRTSVKKQMMLILYDRLHNSKSKELFSKLFPTESEIIHQINSIEGENYLPILLQRMESFFLLEKVCAKIAQELPDAPIIPVHDSIYTAEEFAEPVKKIMEEVLEELTGIKPGIKLENSSSKETLRELLTTVKADYADLIDKNINRRKRKGKPIPVETKVGLKSPVLKEIPENDGKKIFSTRFVDDSADYGRLEEE